MMIPEMRGEGDTLKNAMLPKTGSTAAQIYFRTALLVPKGVSAPHGQNPKRLIPRSFAFAQGRLLRLRDHDERIPCGSSAGDWECRGPSVAQRARSFRMTTWGEAGGAGICTSSFPAGLVASGGAGGCDLVEGDAGGDVVARHDVLHMAHIPIDVVAIAFACVIDPL